MDIFDFALKMELDGEKYYRDLAERAAYDDLKQVLIGLAEDEQRHYKIIESAQKQIKPIEADSSLSQLQNVFVIKKNRESGWENKEDIAKLKDEQFDVYEAALAKEHESVELYKKLKEDAKRPEETMIFGKLMQEEEKHVEVIENILEMLRHANEWVEAAEFNPHNNSY